MLGHSVLLLVCASTVLGHGRVTQPPSRASAWRLGFPTPANYDDDGLNCGGFSTQWSSNGGKCGICGDAYSIPPPRPHELGGTFGLGVIVAKYLPGATIATTTQLTTSHLGYWEFKICPDPTDNTQACFDQHLLLSEDGETKYTPKRGSGVYEVNYKLPSGLICEHCVLQWRYVAGNNWGICSNGTSGLGCGNQEEFRACSDISIGVSKTQNNVENIPSPLLYYLQHGFYELDQGYLTRKDPKRPTPPQRTTNTKPSNRQPKPSKEIQNQRQPQPHQHPQNSIRQPQHSNKQTQHSNRQPPHSNGQQYPQNHPYHSQQQSHNLQKYSQTANRQPYPQNPNVNAEYSQHLNRQTANQAITSQRLTQSSNRPPQYSNQQPNTSHRLTQTEQHPQTSNRQAPSNRQPEHSNRQPQHSNRQPQHSNRQPQHSNRQPQHSNRQPHRTKPSKSKQQTKHKSAKRHPNSKEPKLLRYEYKTNNKRKTKNKRKKKKTQSGLHQKTKKPKRPVKVYEHHTFEYF